MYKHVIPVLPTLSTFYTVYSKRIKSVDKVLKTLSLETREITVDFTVREQHILLTPISMFLLFLYLAKYNRVFSISYIVIETVYKVIQLVSHSKTWKQKRWVDR